MKPRAERLTPPEILAEYGNGEWPLLAAYEKGEVAENGNYIEREELAVRHGVCGDPEQVPTTVDSIYRNLFFVAMGSGGEGTVLLHHDVHLNNWNMVRISATSERWSSVVYNSHE